MRARTASRRSDNKGALSLRDIRDTWATYVMPDDRIKIVNIIGQMPATVKDGEVRKNLGALAGALAATK